MNDIKLIVIGASYTGKTSLINKYTRNFLMKIIKLQLYQNLVPKFLEMMMVNYIVFKYGIWLVKIIFMLLQKHFQKVPMDVLQSVTQQYLKQEKSKLISIIIT